MGTSSNGRRSGQTTFEIFEGKQHLRISQSYLEKLQFESSTLRMWCNDLQDETMDESQRSIVTWCEWLVSSSAHVILKDGLHGGKEEPISHNHLQLQSKVLLQLRLQFQLKAPPLQFQWKQLRQQDRRCPAIQAWPMLQGAHHARVSPVLTRGPRTSLGTSEVEHVSLQPLARKRESKKHSRETSNSKTLFLLLFECAITQPSKEERHV